MSILSWFKQHFMGDGISSPQTPTFSAEPEVSEEVEASSVEEDIPEGVTPVSEAGELVPHEEAAAEDVEEGPPFIDLPRGAIMSVISEQGDFVFFGRVTSCSKTGVTFSTLKDSEGYAPIPRESNVHIQGYLKNMTTVNFSAIVCDSNRWELRVKEPQLIAHDEERSHFRLPVSMDAHYKTIPGKTVGTCKMVNISSVGACFVAPLDNLEGNLMLQVQLLDTVPEHSYTGRVVRKQPRGNEGWEYGIAFYNLTEAEISGLSATLFRIQAQVRREQLEYEENQQ